MKINFFNYRPDEGVTPQGKAYINIYGINSVQPIFIKGEKNKYYNLSADATWVIDEESKKNILKCVGLVEE